MDRTDLIEQRGSFITAVIGGTLALVLAEPVGAALGIGDPSTGRFAIVAYAAAPIAVVAAGLARSWRGVAGLLVGFAAAGGIAGVFADLGSSGDLLTDVIGSGLIVLLSMGVIGAPVYLATIGVMRLLGRRRGATSVSTSLAAPAAALDAHAASSDHP